MLVSGHLLQLGLMGQLKAVLSQVSCFVLFSGHLLQLGLMGQLKAVLLTGKLHCAIQLSSAR